jgi:hypothetical protein
MPRVPRADVNLIAQSSFGLGSWDGRHIQPLRSSDLNVIPPDVKLVVTVANVFVEDLLADGDEIGVGDPGAVEPIAGLALLALTHTLAKARSFASAD